MAEKGETNGTSSNSNNGTAMTTRCGFKEIAIFLIAIISGTACSICSKTMMELRGSPSPGEPEETFEKPIFQTWGMFIGMLFGLVMHEVVIVFRIPFVGYDHDGDIEDFDEEEAKVLLPNYQYGSVGKEPAETKESNSFGGEASNSESETASILPPKKIISKYRRTPTWMYFFLAIPSVFDVGATVLCMMGLRYLDVSIYQLLRGSGIIFVALMKQHVLGDHLYRFQWIGVFWNVVAVFLVGATAILNSDAEESRESEDGVGAPSGAGQALWGVMLVLLGAFVQALQFVFEEKVMALDEATVPPLLLIGMEGLWGTLICLFIVYPVAYYLPGDDHGSYENPFTTYHMFMNNSVIQWSFLIYFFAIFFYNLFAVMVTFLLNSIWHAILDNFRPITVWLTDLAIFYVITLGAHGEDWTNWSYLQLFGMFVLLYGTAIFNAPHSGSLMLRGDWLSFGIDCQQEYEAVQHELHEAALDEAWEKKRKEYKTKRPSSLGERGPHVSVHTQNLRGLSSPKM